MVAFVNALCVRIEKFGKLLCRRSNPDGARSPVRGNFLYINHLPRHATVNNKILAGDKTVVGF